MAQAPTESVLRPPPSGVLRLVRPIRPIPAWGWVGAGAVLSVLVLECLVEGRFFGTGTHATDLESVTYLSLMWAAALLALAGAWVRRDLDGWGLIAIGLLSTAAGDTYFQFWVDPVTGAYPSVADFLYLLEYPLVILGLWNLGRRGQHGVMPFAALLTPLLGVATLWWWLALDPVSGSLEGTTAARLTTIAYPCLDLLLVCSALITMAALGWRTGASLTTLIAGAVIVGVADSAYASQVASGSVPDLTLINVLWPIGTLLMASAAWIADRPDVSGEPSESRLELVFALSAIAIALVVLLWDHFERFSAVTVVLATLTLVAAGTRLVALYYEAIRARREALEAESQRGQIHALHTASVEAALDGIVTADADGRILDWNPAAERIFGYSRGEVLGEAVADLIVPAGQRQAHQRALARAASDGKVKLTGRRQELTGLHRSGAEIPVELAVTRSGTDPVRFTAFIHDITERRRRDEERDRLADMVRSAQDAMVSATLDGIILSWNPAAERIYGYRPEEIVGTPMRRLVPPDRMHQLRSVGEEVSAGQSTAMETIGLCKGGEIIDISLQVFPVRDQTGRVVGASTVTRDITDRREREREKRLDRERQAWQTQIEDALEQGGLEFHPQPVLDLRTGEISHHELLLRMLMDGETVPPGRFLSHAETSPLMRRIDRWAIRRGIRLAAEHPVAINLSATSLSDAGTVAAAEKALREFGADPRDVTFEITETAAVEDLEAAHSLVKALVGLGCGVALDDFGTGYGSFTYLMRLRVTSLKIDMEFIRGLSEDPDDQRVVRAIVAVARNFGLSTVAEGVETESVLEILRELEVDQAQGFLIGRPSGAWTTNAEVVSNLHTAGE
jgi:PAS domain S-box-containing protein